MKNQIRSISLVALFLVALSTIGAAQANNIATVQNNTTENLGSVAIYANGTPTFVYVPGSGMYQVPVPALPECVVINNYLVRQGQSGVAVLPTGKQVKVALSGNIVVIDQSIVQ